MKKRGDEVRDALDMVGSLRFPGNHSNAIDPRLFKYEIAEVPNSLPCIEIARKDRTCGECEPFRVESQEKCDIAHQWASVAGNSL